MLNTLTKIILYSALFSLGFSQGTWGWTNRVHSELKWSTIETENFNVHYHDGIEDIAEKGANIAEQVYPILLKQMGIESTPTIDIIFTAEDEIMNGYASWTNQTFIWVDQNDATIWLEDEKWLYQVLSHELQHIVFFNTVKTWMPQPWGFLFSGCPGWFVEGLAEYYTERWRPYRADLSHKQHVLENSLNKMNSHHDGMSKVLLLAEKYGDSTIVEIVQHRNKWKIFYFKQAFKKATGVSVNQFEEIWRRTMNTYYYGQRAQKESFEDIGITATMPINIMDGFSISADSMKIALIGKDDKGQYDRSLIIAELDTTKKENWYSNIFGSANKSEKNGNDEKKKSKPKFIKTEIDYGRFHEILNWSPDSKQIAYAKYRFGKYGSMIYDLKIYDTETGKDRWITKDQRATYPDWSPDGEKIIFVAHQFSTSNIFEIAPDGSNIQQITDFKGDTQILTPRWSPDGTMITFAIAGESANCDVVILDYGTKEITRLTDNPEVDYLPIWHPDGKKITYTSHKGLTPNLHTVDIQTKNSIQNTDITEAVWGAQWTPKGESIIAATMNDVDSVRIVQVDPNRTITTEPVRIRPDYTSWMHKTPDNLLLEFNPETPVTILQKDKYKFYRYPKHITSFVLPLDVLMGMSVWSDALGKHILQFAGGSDWDFEYPFFMAGYVNAQLGPLWGINYFYNVNWTYRFYNESDSGLWEKFDGCNFWMTHPLNFGNSMSSNHTFTTNISFYERDFEEIQDYDADLESWVAHEFTEQDSIFKPDSGKEGVLSLNYRFVNRRPHKNNIALPKNGYGINLTADFANEDVFGVFSYQRYTFDSFLNIKAGNGAIFLRGKGIALEGDPPAQEYVGLSKDISIYFPGSAGTIGLPENHNLRGFEEYRLGNRMVFGTIELRFPILKSFPIEVLGFSIGEITGALISDFGNAWYSGEDKDDFVVTAGYEAKIALQLGSSPLFFIAVGEAQEIDDWQNEIEPKKYVRFSLINPF